MVTKPDKRAGIWRVNPARRGTCLENSGSHKACGSSPPPVAYAERTQAALSIRWKRIGSVKGMEVGTSSWRIISDGVDAYAR